MCGSQLKHNQVSSGLKSLLLKGKAGFEVKLSNFDKFSYSQGFY